MDVFNKLKSAVSSALPGNPLSRDFDVFSQIGSGGPGMMWKIYNGVKKTTKQDVAIFVFEKKSIERYSRRDKELILESLRKGASQLTRLRHPKILSVIQPLEESRETLAFATEPVFASLANILGNHDNCPAVPKELQEYKMFDVEIKYGLLQVAQGLQFLHNDVKLLHNNICPESIIVNKNGAWKLAGFDFCVPNKNPPDQQPYYEFQPWEPDVPPCAQAHLDYLAPEYALTASCGLACDMFSIGVLIYAMFSNGKPLYECSRQLSSFKKNAEELRKWRGQLLGKVPEDLQDIVKLLLNTEPAVRPDPDQLAKVSYFQDVGAVTLEYMDSLFQQENLQKSKFFKGLPKIITKFPKRVNLQRILPPLLKECANHDMIPFVLPNILQIAQQATNQEYAALILPDLIPMFKNRSHIQILLIFMQNMNLLLKKTPANDIKAHVLPMIYSALESNSPQIQELCLDIIPTFAELIDYQSLKTSIVPRIKKLCLTTSLLGVRVHCLLCLGKLLESMDRWFVLDDVLPILPQVPTREPAILMSILGIYRVALTHAKLGITKDILAGKVLPFLMPLAIDNGLNLQQFNVYISLIKEMVEKVESEHRGKLEQIDEMKREQNNLEITKITEQDENTLVTGVTDDQPQTMMDQFLSGFGISLRGSGDGKSVDQSSAVSPASTVTPPSQPAKVNLSLEEKQKLAKQQEQQKFLKAQKPVSASSTSTNRTKQALNKPKDLTSSLMDTNMSRLQSSTSNIQTSGASTGTGGYHSGVPPRQLPANTMAAGYMPSSVGMTSGFNSTPNFQQGITSSSGSTPYGMANSSGMNQNSFGGQISGGQGQRSQTGNSMDLSAFDSLLPGNSNQKVPMNQMTQNKTTTSVQSSVGGNPGFMSNSGIPGQSMMGNPSMMGNQGFMGPGMTGHVTHSNGQNVGSGLNTTFPQSNQGNMGHFPSQPMGGQNMLQPQPIGNQNTTHSTSNDISDWLG